MNRVSYPWGNELREIFRDAKGDNAYEEVEKALASLLETWRREKKIPRNTTLHRFLDAAKNQARRMAIPMEDYKRSAPFQKWDEKRIQKFKDAIAKGFPDAELQKTFPELLTLSILTNAKREFFRGGQMEIATVRKRYAEQEERREKKMFRRLLPILRKERKIRHRNAYFVFKELSKEAVRGILQKLVEREYLTAISDLEEDCLWYFVNNEDFYTSEELYELIPEKEKNRVLDLLKNSKQPLGLGQLATALAISGEQFLQTFLSFFVGRGLFDITAKGYRLSSFGQEFGVDSQSILTLKAVVLENQLELKKETQNGHVHSLRDVEEALTRDHKEKQVEPVDVSHDLRGDSFKLLFLAEILYGNQNTDQRFIRWALEQSKPDIAIATGLVQGTFTGYRVDKQRVLANEGGLDKISGQFDAAGLLLKRLADITSKRVFVVQGDDDWDLAKNYAHLAQLSEGKVWNYGVATHSLTAELKRRLNIIEFYKKLKIQWERILQYQYRIGRSLLNKNEVSEKIGVSKSEYRLIMEILVAERNHFPYPEHYKKVVDIAALFGKAEKRVVTPDALALNIGSYEIQLVHNTQFSDITQYVDPAYTVERIMRHFGARGDKMPWMLLDAQQEFLYLMYVQGHWVGCLPGLQDATLAAKYRKKTFSTRVLSSKSHRQNTFRKSPASPGVPEFEIFKDGRVRMRFLNNSIREVIESQRKEPHVKETVAILQDLQHGSITMQPEYEMKYMDYALYTRKATRLYENGDILQGFIYPAFVAENRPSRLVSVDSQQRFTLEIQMPLIVGAPYLRDFAAWMGNHEWNIWTNALTGQNALHFLEVALQWWMRAKGKGTTLERAMTVSRIRFAKTPNPHGGDIINHPYFSTEIAGFKLAITHMWLPHGGGRTPVDQQRRWLANMADAAGDIHVMIGGDKHSTYLAQEYDKLLFQLPASASQSGYELARGLMSTVMYTLVEFDNRNGVTLEFIPWQFLEKYKCISPFLKGKDDELKRPAEGTPEYEQGKMSPYVEGVIDRLTRYMKV
ncbi:MAG: hypothetical protein AAB631_01655 [Patescibacteria group bacterium]